MIPHSYNCAYPLSFILTATESVWVTTIATRVWQCLSMLGTHTGLHNLPLPALRCLLQLQLSQEPTPLLNSAVPHTFQHHQSFAHEDTFFSNVLSLIIFLIKGSSDISSLTLHLSQLLPPTHTWPTLHTTALEHFSPLTDIYRPSSVQMKNVSCHISEQRMLWPLSPQLLQPPPTVHPKRMQDRKKQCTGPGQFRCTSKE